MFGFISKRKHNQQLRDAKRLIEYYKHQLQDADRAYLKLAEEYRTLGTAFSSLKKLRQSFRP